MTRLSRPADNLIRLSRYQLATCLASLLVLLHLQLFDPIALRAPFRCAQTIGLTLDARHLADSHRTLAMFTSVVVRNNLVTTEVDKDFDTASYSQVSMIVKHI